MLVRGRLVFDLAGVVFTDAACYVCFNLVMIMYLGVRELVFI